MKTPDLSLSNQIRKARQESGLSQNELAERMSIHRNTVVRWESRLSEPSPVQLKFMAEIVGKPLSFFTAPVKVSKSASPTERMEPWMQEASLARLQELTPHALRRLRRENHFTISDMAHRMGVTNMVIRGWMNGGMVPTAEDLKKLRERFGDSFNPTPFLTRRVSQKEKDDMLKLILRKLEWLEGAVTKIQCTLEGREPEAPTEINTDI